MPTRLAFAWQDPGRKTPRLPRSADPSDIAPQILASGAAGRCRAFSEREEQRSRIVLAELASAFLKMGLCGFGGVLPFARRVLVEERAWLSEREFAEILGLCQALPGLTSSMPQSSSASAFAAFAGSVTCILSLMTACWPYRRDARHEHAELGDHPLWLLSCGAVLGIALG